MIQKARNLFLGGVPTAPDVQSMIEAFGVPEEGSVVSCEAIEAAINAPRGSDRYKTVIGAWKKRMENEHGVVLVAVPNVGYKAADPNGKLDVSHGYFKQSIRRASRCSKIAGITDKRRLDADGQRALEHYRKIAGVVRLAASVKPKELPSGE